MAKREVIEIECERCKRTELVRPEEYNELPDFEVKFGHDSPSGVKPDVEVRFDDLCSSCNKTIRNALEKLVKPISYRRVDDGEEEVEIELPMGVGSSKVQY